MLNCGFGEKIASYYGSSLMPSGITDSSLKYHLENAKKDNWFSHLAVEVHGVDTSTEWCEPVTDKEYDRLGE